uniref:Secreted protein n=1 Tax=Rhizophora mucronata TaxID=61149 RepID=A0A2P2NM94_RHIMU
MVKREYASRFLVLLFFLFLAKQQLCPLCMPDSSQGQLIFDFMIAFYSEDFGRLGLFIMASTLKAAIIMLTRGNNFYRNFLLRF